MTLHPDTPNVIPPEESQRMLAELRAVRAELETAKKRCIELFDLAPLGYCTLNEDSLIAESNLTTAKLLGFSAEELQGQQFHKYVFKDDQDVFLRQLRKLFADGEAGAFELRMLKKDGTVFWGQVKPFIARDAENKSICRIAISDITEHKRTEHALRLSNERFRRFVDSNIVGIVIVGPSGAIYEANDYYLRMIGYTREEFEQGKVDWRLITPPEWIQEDEKAIRELREKGICTPYEKEYVRRDGSRVSVFLTDTMLPGPEEVIAAFALDISERKRTEKQLRRNEMHLKGLVNILEYRAETTQEFLDHALSEAIKLSGSKIGYIYFYHEDRKEFVLNSWSKDVMKECSVVNPQTCYELDRTGVWGEAVRQRKAIIINDFQSRNPLRKGYPEGHVRLDRFMTVPVFKEERIIAVVGVANKVNDYDEADVLQLNLLMEAVWKCVDIKKGEEALRTNEKKLSKLISSMEQGLATHEIILDGNGVPVDYRFLDVNPSFERITGLKKESIIGRTVLEVFPNTEKIWIDKYGYVALTGEPLHFEAYSRELGKHFEVAAYRPELNTFATIISDISKRKQTEEERENLELQLRESQKMQAVGQLAGGISHDFNNLLSIINGYSQMLLKNAELKKSDRLKIEEILKAGELASTLTRQLLVFSRHQPLEPKVIDLNSIVSGMNKMLRRLIRESIAMNVLTESELWRIKADPGQIEQVIMNLVVNARDAMLDGGTLTIKTENAQIDGNKRLAHHPEIKPGKYVLLSVSDTGCGMDGTVREHIFEPFFTTKEIGKGTGLGLAIVYGIIKQCNAYVDVDSEVGKGTTFRIYFPQIAPEDSAEVESGNMMPLPGGNETILLAEDEGVIRDLLQEFLQSVGYVVLPSGNAMEALELAEKHKGRIHLLLTDIVMPEMNGFELAKKLRKSIPGIKFIFMTGYSKPGETHGMIRMNNNLIQKPISIHGLALKLREILDK